MDHATDMQAANKAFTGETAFIGNLDPVGVLLNGTPEEVKVKTRELIEVFSDNPRFILNAGCALPPGTPAENIHAMIAAARESY